ncbi:unnamed protein product [Lupinus luteus]|uniref:Uncharacterized protein n=1 Tax=Lupinus luteus TaxID=3873 RepID=A0AAV1XXC4_LUPLU
MQHIIPILKHSLSLTLQHFFPLAATLLSPPKPHKPHILYVDGDSIPFIVAKSTSSFTQLVSHTSKNVKDLHPLVPKLPKSRSLEDGTSLLSLLSIQVTLLSNSGFSICVNFNHVVADGKAFHHFMKSWSSLCRTKGDLTSLKGLLPFHDRAMIVDPKNLELCFLNEFWNWPSEQREKTKNDPLEDKVRGTFILSHEQVQKVRKWVSTKSEQNIAKDNECHEKSDEVYNFAFPVDCRNRFGFPIPSTYFGNCLISHSVALKRDALVEENGVLEAIKAIGNKVKELEFGVMEGAEKWISNYRESRKLEQRRLTVAGSTRLGVYETDFGWGRPLKSEVVHIDASGSISLSDCRNKEGEVEVGLALGRAQMNDFNAILRNTMKNLQNDEF